MSKNKVARDSIPNDFTLSLVIVDSIPVILFGLSMIMISRIFSSTIFLLGAVLSLFAGICKVLWKLIVVLKQRNIWFLFIQMRITMPIGLLLMLVGVIVNYQTLDWSMLLRNITSMPTIIFFIVGIVCMSMMLVFAFVLDGNDVKNNWLEQITNIIGQLGFFVGLCLLV